MWVTDESMSANNLGVSGQGHTMPMLSKWYVYPQTCRRQNDWKMIYIYDDLFPRADEESVNTRAGTQVRRILHCVNDECIRTSYILTGPSERPVRS